MERGTKIVIAFALITALASVGMYYGAIFLRHTLVTKELLVITATDEVGTNAPAGVLIPADFGPHCRKAVFASSGALVVDADALPASARGVVIITHAASGGFTSDGGDQVKLIFFTVSETQVPIRSAVDPDRVLFTIESDVPTIRIGPLTLDPDRTVYRGSFTTVVTVGPDSWTVTEAYTLENLGTRPTTVRPPLACA